MGTYKLLLDDTLEFDFTLIAIHCSIEAYHLAFLLNKHLGIRLARTHKDLPISFDATSISFPLYEYDDEKNYLRYHLLSNRIREEISTQSGGLFDSNVSQSAMYHVMPDYRKVDYVLKVYEDGYAFAKANTLASLNKIPQVITAYSIDVSTLKTKENLIFE